jgi:hypothetical protein
MYIGGKGDGASGSSGGGSVGGGRNAGSGQVVGLLLREVPQEAIVPTIPQSDGIEKQATKI